MSAPIEGNTTVRDILLQYSGLTNSDDVELISVLNEFDAIDSILADLKLDSSLATIPYLKTLFNKSCVVTNRGRDKYGSYLVHVSIPDMGSFYLDWTVDY